MKRYLPTWFRAGLAMWCALAATAWGQRRPHIGYAYPAGGQIGTTFQVKLGGQDLDEVTSALITGNGVTVKSVEVLRRLNNQEIQLINEQLRALRRAAPPAGKVPAPGPAAGTPQDEASRKLVERIERRVREWVQTPACASIASIVNLELIVAPEAALGPRELRLVSPRGVSNPLTFVVGQFPEYSRKPMLTATIQILGKEAGALRKRPPEELEDRVALPCTLNGQIASGEVNRYRFEASKGQRLVISTLARQLIPFVADAVPGWFQPVVVVYDAQGRELAYADDYRFKPDPVIVFEVPRDGEYVCEVKDSLYRGREDFVYRLTIGELPFVTSVFPLGGQVGAARLPAMQGVNLIDADLTSAWNGKVPGIWPLAASRLGYESNRVPFALDRLRDEFEQPDLPAGAAQRVELPVVINGRIDRPDDWDVYEFTASAGQAIVAEVQARRLDSPLDSVLKLTDAAGRVIAFNDDREDLTAGLNTHHADSYLMAKLPAAGAYRLHIGDTARQGGEEYGYRLRLGPPQPDFDLRVVPTSVSLPAGSTTALTIFAVRRDGFNGPIKLALKEAVGGITAAPVTLAANQTSTRLTIRSGPQATKGPVRLVVTGTAKIGANEVVRHAVPSEDKMQAFLWRHLVPASELPVVVFDRNYQPEARRPLPARPAPTLAATVAAVAQAAAVPSTPASAPTTTSGTSSDKPKFSKQQIAGRLRQLKLLYEEGLLSDDFYLVKVAECDVAQ